jgi:transmembrane sensor
MPQAPIRPARTDPIADQAAFWCMRLHDETCTAQDREAFARWLDSDPEHAAEYQAMLEIWDVSGTLSTAEPPRPARRLPLAIAASALLAAVLGWAFGYIPDTYDRYHAGHELLEVVLADGSHAQLNRGTSLIYLGFRDRRQVLLDAGEAFFDVRHDATHPFVVSAADGRIVVTGTEFNVWKYEDQVVVTVREGSVRVTGGDDSADSVDLSPARQARYGPGITVPEVADADPDVALAWREGRLVIDNLPLSQALPLINRYLDQPVQLVDEATGDLRVGGIFNTNDMPAVVMQLPKVLPVRVEKNVDGDLVIKRRGPAASS